jgi:hypothetical protein
MEKTLVRELTYFEMVTIDGGKPVSYYIGFAIGAAAGTFVSLLLGIFDGVEGNHK